MYDLSASRLTAFVAVIVAALMIGSPAWVFGNTDVDPVGEVSAADGTRIFRIGVVDMTISTLNPNTYTMVAEGMAIFPMFSTLMQWDAAGENIVGDLAKSWSFSPDGLTYECELVDTAYWVVWNADTDTLDKGPQVTSADVKWSIDTLASEDGSRLNSYWPEFDGLNIIQETWCPDSMHFGITIREPFVPFQESLMGNPIFPKYIWENEDFINFDNYPFVSSGAYFYKTEGDPDAGFVELGRNPYWHGDVSYGWQLHVDDYVMVRYDDSTTLYEGLKNGDVDCIMGVDPATFVYDLPDQDNLVGYSQSNGFVYEFNLNQMTDALRAELGGSFNAGVNNQLLLDPTVKKAISMCVDRQGLIDEYLYGYGTYTTTLVPTQNPMSHTYATDGHDCLLDPGATEAVIDPWDPAAARQMLMDAGWAYTTSGTPANADTVPLCKAGGADPLSFNFYTLDTSNTWEGMCNDIVNWTRAAGVLLTLELASVNELNTIWYAADYDIWLWDWVLYPYGEAVSSVLSLFTTDVIGTDSDVYVSSAEYDAMYNEAIREMDYYKRQEICYDMQDWVYLNRGCQALAFREDLYAFNIDMWENFGDLENEYFMLPDVWPVWLSAQMNPVGNAAPFIGGVSVTNNTVSNLAEVGTAVSFSAAGVSDDHQAAGDLEYKWIWGFGGEQEVAGSSVNHVFTEDGVYSVTLVVRETAPADGHADYLSSYYTYYITVHDMSNMAPHGLSIAMDIPDPTAGELVTFTGTAVDDESDELYYSWAFGDGSSAVVGDVVEHQFPADGSYTVTLMVDDHHYGELGTRPATESQLVAVGPNHAPSISVPDYGEITNKVVQTFTVMASDADPRDDIRYTWDWGDGSFSVTTDPYIDHAYNFKGSYVVTVYADDLTGLEGHNVSDAGTVTVVVSGNNIPAIVLYEVEPSNSAFLGETLTFLAIAGDGDGDALTFTFDFDDGTTAVESFAATLPNDQVECTAEKTYAAAGTYSVYLTVTDGTATALSPELVVTVEENVAPVITAFAPEPYWDTGVSMDFVVSAYDEDGDFPLRYTWDWDDGETEETLISVATHTFADSGTYTVGVTVDDFKGFSDYAEADVTVNSAPYIDPPLSVRSVDEDAAYDYSVSAYDDDGDALTYMWDFGDGTVVLGQSVSHTYADQGTYTYSVCVWDDFVEFRPLTHNVTSSSTVYVGAAGVDDPPVIEPMADVSAVEGEEVELWVYASDDGGEDLLTYIWDFGDGSDLLVADPPVNHVWDTANDYTLTVWVHDDSGLPGNNVSATAAVHIVGDEPPIADAGGDRTVAEEVSVGFTAEDSDDDLGVVGYAWTVNDYDGAYSFDTMSFSYTFHMPGAYSVELVVEDTIGQLSDPDVITVTVTDETPPTADAGPDQTVANGTTVLFSGSGVDGDDYDTALDFEWTFIYDGALETMTGESPSFLFEIVGGYVVTLTVTDDAGNFAEDEMTVTVEDVVDPVADAGPDQTVDEGDTVTFDGSDSYDADTSIIVYEWDFTYDGAEETLTGDAPSFVFDIAGPYVVTLTVTDEGGNTATDTVTITVNEVVVVNEPPVADAGADQPDVITGDTVTFDGSDSSDDVLVTNYTWAFTYDGDAVELWGVGPTFVFDIADAYVVTLTVSDAEGETATDTVTITVSEPAPVANVAPVADAGDDQTVTEGATVTFDGTGSTDSDGTIASYWWTFTYDGTAQNLSGSAPTFDFEVAGTYTVTLTVTDDDGSTSTDTVTITVSAAEPPPADDGDDKSFLEAYGLPIAIIVIVLVVVVVAMLLMKKKKSA